MLATYDIVTVNGDFEDREIAGRRGYIIGMVEGDDIAVFVYEVERVWCLQAFDVTPTGERDTDAQAEAEAARRMVVRVSSKGELLD